ncbi:conjugal transfer protein TraD [Bradyrhizobium sp. SZCCHNPS1003]|uniref:conjugal transfer protein TraD n=1 Tax=Bradyrhizobium sp. SZCCHNPS1003 TaxID=3057330 RepID=UPI0028E93A2D|nr:conjugal transfer protein TraD [Bradyrhizobium sp. SZCCHNPS1003]
MRKQRDFDADLKALEDKARELKTRKVRQLGELVIAIGADTLTVEELAGALIVLAETKEAGKREALISRRISASGAFSTSARRFIISSVIGGSSNQVGVSNPTLPGNRR